MATSDDWIKISKGTNTFSPTSTSKKPFYIATSNAYSILLQYAATSQPTIPLHTVSPHLLQHKALAYSNSKQSGPYMITNLNMPQWQLTTCSLTTILLGWRMNALLQPRPTPIIPAANTLTKPTTHMQTQGCLFPGHQKCRLCPCCKPQT